MSIKTRLDSRSTTNDRFEIRDKEGNVIAEVIHMGPASANLEVSTVEGLHIAKPSGWNSIK